MKRFLSLSAALAALLAAAAPGAAAPSAPDAMSSVRFLIGTWTCAHTVGDFSGIYTETFASAMGGRWLTQTYEFPATKAEPAVHAEYFIEYDPRVPRWVRFGAHSNGQYYAQYSKSDGPGDWVWNYVMPSSGGSSSTWMKKSEREYTIDGPSYPENGKMVTEHHVCKKST